MVCDYGNVKMTLHQIQKKQNRLFSTLSNLLVSALIELIYDLRSGGESRGYDLSGSSGSALVAGGFSPWAKQHGIKTLL